MGKTGDDQDGLHSGKLEKRRLDLNQIYFILYESVIYDAQKSCLVVHAAMILPPKNIALPS